MRPIDVAGKRFGRLVALRRDGSDAHGQAIWICACDCGATYRARATSLKTGNARSCGCVRREQISARNTKHGACKTPEYRLWTWAKHRAKVAGLEFDIELSDIHIPKNCPVFGFALKPRLTQGPNPESPSLDRIDPHRGYVKGNVWVISHRANTVKNGFTLEELEKVVLAIKKWTCAECGTRQDRDVNAALNTLLSGQGLASKSEIASCERRIERARQERASEIQAR